MPFPDSFFNPLSVYKRKIERKLFGVISLTQNGTLKGSALLSFVTHPFAITKSELQKSPHTTPWECMEMACILLERGYSVDVIEWNNSTFQPKKQYSIIIDSHQNIERLQSVLPKTCIKIHYITGAHAEYQNRAELTRLQEFTKRRGATLIPRRQMLPSRNIEYADYAIALGNDFAKDTYAYSGKKIAQLPLFSNAFFPSPEHKDFEKVKRNFVWIGGGGAIHKGLDLVLEAFAVLPDYHLTVCGPVEAEKDFYDFYRKELCDTPNIKFVGRIDVGGPQFKAITDNAVGLIYPSSSEGQSGSVVTALHAGLIPIVTYQSGVDVSPFGYTLQDFSVSEVTNSIQKISALPVEELQRRAVAAWTYARENHTREIYRKKYGDFIDAIIKEKNI